MFFFLLLLFIVMHWTAQIRHMFKVFEVTLRRKQSIAARSCCCCCKSNKCKFVFYNLWPIHSINCEWQPLPFKCYDLHIGMCVCTWLPIEISPSRVIYLFGSRYNLWWTHMLIELAFLLCVFSVFIGWYAIYHPVKKYCTKKKMCDHNLSRTAFDIKYAKTKNKTFTWNYGVLSLYLSLTLSLAHSLPSSLHI